MSERDALMAQLPPGPNLPLAIGLVAFWKRPAASLERLRARYGKRFTVRLPFQPPFVMLSDPEEIKQLFTAPADVVHPGEGARILEPIVGSKSVILLDEAPHLEQRKLLLPAFHGEQMQALAGLMTELAEHEIDSWPVGEPIALHERLQRVTLEIILRAVFGLDRGRQLDELRDLLTDVLEFSTSPLSVLPIAQQKLSWFGPVKRLNGLLAKTDKLIDEVIAERRTDAEHRGGDILSMLLEARHEDGTEMSRQEIRDELMTALVAGHETTASQLAWAFELIGRAPAVQDELRAELDAGEGDAYLTATINEVLRMRPVLANAEPRLTKQPIEIGGWRYPAGVLLLANAFLVHRDPAIYPEPYAFRPERFLGVKPGTYTFLPFGGGRRRCLGASFALLEMKIVLRSVLSRYEVVPARARAEMTARRSITFSPDRGAEVVLNQRVSAEAAGSRTMNAPPEPAVA
jgi:cytochrome P450